MAKDAGDMIGAALGTIAREIGQSVSSNGQKGAFQRGSDGFSGARGVAAGAALATAAPFAGKAVKKLVAKGAGSSASKGSAAVKEKLTQTAKSGVGKGVKDAVGEKLPGGGREDKGEKGTPGVGKGRRMPVQQAADIGVPISVVYNQWTQMEEWPQFMHRLDQVTQEDDCTVSFKAKLWGMSKEFVAQIVEQRPEERIQWSVKEGVTHTGVVTFHELAPRLTRVQVSLDVEPGSWIEKAARGMRHVKRAVRADLARFKSFIEMQEVETGAWRGEIHDGRVARRQERRTRARRKTASRSESRGRSRSRRRSRSGSRRRRSPSHR